MRKVVDAGALRAPELEAFFRASRQNVAVITEHAALESFKGDAKTNVRRNFAILSRFLTQVVVLKQTPQIIRLRPRRPGLHGRLIDEVQTKRFREYCRSLSTGRPVDFRQEEALADEHFGHWAKAASIARDGIAKMASGYAPADLKALRCGQPIRPQFAQLMVNEILHFTAVHFRDFPHAPRSPSSEDTLYSFAFRYAVCGYALALRWIADGGVESAGSAKLNNDLIDMTYAAYATFFDGLITRDGKLRDVHQLARRILVELFDLDI